MSDEPLVYVVIPQYTKAKQTLAVIEAINKTSYSNKVIMVVDDCSPDNAYDNLKAIVPEGVLVRKTEKNRHACATVNLGIRECLQRNAEYILVVGSDFGNFSQDFFQCILAEFKRDSKIGLVGNTVLFEDGSARWDGSAKNVLGFDLAISESFTMSRKALNQVGLLNEKLAFGFEDLDLVLRMENHDFKTGFAKGASVVHRGKGSASSSLRLLYKRRYLRIRNILMMLRRYGTHRPFLSSVKCYLSRSLANYKEAWDAFRHFRMIEAITTLLAIFFGTVVGLYTSWEDKDEQTLRLPTFSEHVVSQ